MPFWLGKIFRFSFISFITFFCSSHVSESSYIICASEWVGQNMGKKNLD
jgi:hypothetical protein